MEDLTLKSDLFNNIKFNMQKLILDVPTTDAEWLAKIFAANEADVGKLLGEFKELLHSQAIKIREEVEIPSINRPVRIAFVGDSITSDRASYLNIIRELYKDDPNITLIDAAVSGDKTDDAVMKFYFRTLDQKPDIVHILLGTNDLRHNQDSFGRSCLSLEEIRRNYEYMLHTLQVRRIPAVISQISPTITEHCRLRFPDDNWAYVQDEIDRVNAIIAEEADKYDAILNPVSVEYKKYKPEELLLQDGLHLNETGQYILTKSVLQSLAKVLK